VAQSPGRRSLSLVFRDAGCLPALRRWLRSSLPAGSDLEVDAELVCCELITNAVEHGGGVAAVRVDVLGNRRVRVEVDDHDTASVLTVGRSCMGENRGRGLIIVNAVASWGVARTATGKTVWATL